MSEPPRGRNLKLELTWVGKDHRPRLEPRILLIDDTLSHTAAARVTDTDQFENMLIFGDNLLALKALATDEKVRGKVKCIFIDPPYNTGSAFEHYDDGMEHSLWLSMMRERLELLRELLSEDGSIWISIDDNEAHYLKVLCDEIFGRRNFIADVIWQKKFSPANDSKWLSDNHDHILVFALKKEVWRPNLLERSDKQKANFKNPDDDLRGSWISADYTSNKNSRERPSLYYPLIRPADGAEIWPKENAVWRYSRETHEANEKDGLVWWGKDGLNPTPRRKKFIENIREGMVPITVWLHEEVGHTQEAKKEQLVLMPIDPFGTPKPERLLERIIHLATKPGDLVLDSFAGSGTTGAVAHKMGRRWIMIELGEHAHTHILPRLRKVLDGTDAGGISSSANWKGGGGFRYYRLAPSLIKKDLRGQYIINPEYNAEMLAEACCKLSGFAYAPSEATWWQHGRSSERDYLFVTTRYLSFAELQDLSEEVGPERSLLVLAKAFDREGEVLGNLSVRKIPEEILGKCEWDHDDYSLKIENLPRAAKLEPEPVTMGVGSRAGRRAALSEPGLFDSLSSGSGEE